MNPLPAAAAPVIRAFAGSPVFVAAITGRILYNTAIRNGFAGPNHGRHGLPIYHVYI